MQQGNVYINIGATGTNYTDSEINGASGTYGASGTNYGMYGASGTNYNYGMSGASGTNYNYGMSGASGTNYNYGMSGASGTNYNELYINNIENFGPYGTNSNVNVHVGPSGTYSNVNINVGASGTFINSNNNQLLTGNYHSQQYSYDFINGLSKQNAYDKVGINDDDFNFQAGMLFETKRRYHLSYKNFKFDVVIDINQLEDENLICNTEFKKMLQYINSIMDIVDDDRIKKYCNLIIYKDYFINKNLKRSIHITI